MGRNRVEEASLNLLWYQILKDKEE
jgi:hypothetical protein